MVLKGGSIARLSGALLITIVAVVQWAVVLERSWAAIWGWYKFYGYGGGQITVGTNTQILFYILSTFFVCVGLKLSRLQAQDDRSGRAVQKLCYTGALLLVIGMLFWTIILISPLAVFR
ncbi:MAG: hypothetical protein M0P70_16355 [Desulfobulbaceae bacterium]|nr:hypothetical protein [Desulfobulbaceae bacterium]